jgi:hypothetical protein
MKTHYYATKVDAKERIGELFNISPDLIVEFLDFLKGMGHFEQVSAPHHAFEFREHNIDYVGVFCSRYEIRRYRE